MRNLSSLLFSLFFVVPIFFGCSKDNNQAGGGTTPVAATITALNCIGATNNGTLTKGTPATNVTSFISYNGGNGGTYTSQSISSTGVTGLIATLTAGTLASGSGSLKYTITGTPASTGTASFAISLGGQSCTLSITVNNGSINPNTVTDASGNIYPIVTIGTQVWMAENLRTTKFRDGSSIPVVTDSAQWTNNLFNGNPSLKSMMCWYNNDSLTNAANKIGALYTWYSIDPASNGNKNVCPTGWHIPTDDEWITLTTFLGGVSVAGGQMKSTNTLYWFDPNKDATNISGFSGLGGGYRFDDGSFQNMGYFGYWWSATEVDPDEAKYYNLFYSLGDIGKGNIFKARGYSVRCIRD
jgi:uncharacterized protein (TIGR02145 family)